MKVELCHFDTDILNIFFLLLFFYSSSRPESPSGCVTPNKLANQNLEKDSEAACNGSSSAQEYTGTVKVLQLGTLFPCYKKNDWLLYYVLFSTCSQVRSSSKNPVSNPTNSSSITRCHTAV